MGATLAVGLVVIALIGAGVAYETGYLPLSEVLEVKEPVGYSKLDTSDLEAKYQSVLDQIPGSDEIRKEAYGSDSSALEIYVDYKQRLEKEGYKQVAEGEAIVDGVNVKYYGFSEGITGVGIIITAGSEVNMPYESVVLYTTGNILSYEKMIDWYNSQ